MPKPDITPFSKARLGDESYVYTLPDSGWVIDLEWFDDREAPMTVRRQVWRLISEDVITLDDPYADDDDA